MEEASASAGGAAGSSMCESELERLLGNTEFVDDMKVRECIHSSRDGVPPRLRARVWRALLMDPQRAAETANTMEEVHKWLQNTQLDETNQRVIRGDVDRTRAGLAFFQSDAIRAEMEALLTFYCKSRGLRYKQGLNEVLAPFIYLREGDPTFDSAEAFVCFQAFVSRYLPTAFSDDDFISLQCSFHLFHHLLRYHDPTLATYLDRYEVTPELYVTPWFLTVFSSKTPMDALMALWDRYIAEDDRFFFCFLGLALILKRRRALFDTDESQLPETLTRITVESYQDLEQVWRTAEELKKNTPTSFAHRLSATSQSGQIFRPPHLDQLEREGAFHLLPAEILSHCYGLKGPNFSWKLLLLDIRPRWQFDAGHLPLAIHVDRRGDWQDQLLTLCPENFDSTHAADRYYTQGNQDNENDTSACDAYGEDAEPEGEGSPVPDADGSSPRAHPYHHDHDHQQIEHTHRSRDRDREMERDKTLCPPHPLSSDGSSPIRSKSVDPSLITGNREPHALDRMAGDGDEWSPSGRRATDDGSATTKAKGSGRSEPALGGKRGGAMRRERERESCMAPMHHICLLSSSDDTHRDALRYYNFLTSDMKMRYVSIAKGGYKDCHAMALKGGLDLVDHRTFECHVCSPNYKPPRAILAQAPSSPALHPFRTPIPSPPSEQPPSPISPLEDADPWENLSLSDAKGSAPFPPPSAAVTSFVSNIWTAAQKRVRSSLQSAQSQAFLSAAAAASASEASSSVSGAETSERAGEGAGRPQRHHHHHAERREPHHGKRNMHAEASLEPPPGLDVTRLEWGLLQSMKKSGARLFPCRIDVLVYIMDDTRTDEPTSAPPADGPPNDAAKTSPPPRAPAPAADGTSPAPSPQLYYYVPDRGPCTLAVTPLEILCVSDPKGAKPHDDETSGEADERSGSGDDSGEAGEPGAPGAAGDGDGGSGGGAECEGESVLVHAHFWLKDVLKITSKKSSPRVLFFYFNQLQSKPLMTLEFQTEALAHEAIAQIRGMYRSYKAKESRRKTSEDAASCGGGGHDVKTDDTEAQCV
ncbi:unnamed protein product [Vitrella brassicaformis CCMP3155]|uniref:TBC1 domain family member 23 n=5 Tax=Vitrella brassicaformis TaxID=1169539 RepID=A0A0G4H5H2_VITBC|nr:unnamed protein product [Vitrella brassicaformis CCMP3155]|eukprot:CEM39047.1 unnamed protein product [Vitrella brassicaformis CCMP3155]